MSAAHGHDHENEPSAKTRLMMRALVVDAATAEVATTCAALGVRMILLKGPALSRWLYDDDALRPYGDADLLISEEHLSIVEQQLRTLGYALAPMSALAGDFPRHARGWVRSGGGSVDLHTTLPGAEADPATVWEVIAKRTVTMNVGGADVEVLAEPTRALMVALHAAKDGTRVAKVRHDLGHALERLDASLWREAAEVAALIDATSAFASGLRVLPAGAELANELGLPFEQTTLVALRSEASGPPPLAVGIEWLLNERGVRRRASVVVRKVFPPPDYLRASSALADRGRLGLFAAYLARPFIMLARAVPASRAVWRARRHQHSHHGEP